MTYHSKLPNKLVKLLNRTRTIKWQSGLYAGVSFARKLSLDIDIYFLTRENEAGLSALHHPFPVGYSSSLINPATDEKDMQAIAKLNEWSTHDRILERLNAGQQCLAIRYDENVVGYSWARFDKIDEPGCKVKLAKNSVFLHGAFIHPAHRSKGLAPAMRASIYALLEEQGINQFTSATDVLNLSARRFKAKLGACQSMRYVSVRFFGITLLQYKTSTSEPCLSNIRYKNNQIPHQPCFPKSR